MMPMPLVIFHLKDNIERKTSNNIANNMEMEHPTPDESTSMGAWFTKQYKSHGKGNLKHRKKNIITVQNLKKKIVLPALFSETYFDQISLNLWPKKGRRQWTGQNNL